MSSRLAVGYWTMRRLAWVVLIVALCASPAVSVSATTPQPILTATEIQVRDRAKAAKEAAREKAAKEAKRKADEEARRIAAGATDKKEIAGTITGAVPAPAAMQAVNPSRKLFEQHRVALHLASNDLELLHRSTDEHLRRGQRLTADQLTQLHLAAQSTPKLQQILQEPQLRCEAMGYEVKRVWLLAAGGANPANVSAELPVLESKFGGEAGCVFLWEGRPYTLSVALTRIREQLTASVTGGGTPK